MSASENKSLTAINPANRAAMKKMISTCHLVVAGEEKIKPQNQEIWHEKALTLKIHSILKTY